MKALSYKIAFITSTLSSPFLTIPFFSLLTIYYHSPNIQDFLLWSIIFIVFSVLLPLAYILLSIKHGKITDLHVAVREQRSKPFLVAIAGALLMLTTLHFISAPIALIAMSWALLVNGIIFALITHYWKVSMHSASFASSLVIASVLISPKWLLLYPLIVLIFWARLSRKKHNIWQLTAATIISPLLTALILLLFH